jgi:hypothetical protein
VVRVSIFAQLEGYIVGVEVELVVGNPVVIEGISSEEARCSVVRIEDLARELTRCLDYATPLVQVKSRSQKPPPLTPWLVT